MWMPVMAGQGPTLTTLTDMLLNSAAVEDPDYKCVVVLN